MFAIDVMTVGRRVVVLALVACLGAAAPFAQRPATGATKNSRSTLSEPRRKDVQAIVTLADDLVAGRTVANDLALTWVRDDLFKAQDNKQYVPFTVSLDPAKLTPPVGPAAQSGESLEMYWRVVSRSVSAPSASTTTEAQDAKSDRPDIAYEDITPAPVVAGPTLRLSRSFSVPPGSYDVYVVVRENSPAPRTTPPKASAIKRTLVVPDLWNGDLSASTVIIAERIDPLTTTLTAQQRVTRPYALETVEVVPFTRTRFAKREELSVFLQIYNARTDAEQKPDVSVQFNFYAKQATGGEKFFNKTMPTNLNARTLPKDFSLASGRQLQTGQAVQLATFPEGEYRLEIRVTDNLAKKTLARDVSFAVSAT